MRTMIGGLLAALSLFAGSAAVAQPARPPADPAPAVAEATRPFAYSGERISGPGADRFVEATRNAEFVFFGEDHHDYETPLLALAIYATLRDRHGFRYAVVEQDPVAIDAVLRRGIRGSAPAIGAYLRSQPTALGFASDQDLQFLAYASRFDGRGGPALFGVEQTQATIPTLERLQRLARTPAARSAVAALIAHVRTQEPDRAHFLRFLYGDETAEARVAALRSAFGPQPGSEADYLLTALARSIEIYSYFRRASAGEPVGLFNNTVREEWLKENFLRRYRPIASQGPHPRMFFKFGATHMYRGRSPVNAFTIANFAHDLARLNDMSGHGIYVISFGGYTSWNDAPAWMRPLLPAERPSTPLIVDLAALRGRTHQGLFRGSVEPRDEWRLRDLVFGFDSLVIIPNSRKSTWDLTGFPVP